MQLHAVLAHIYVGQDHHDCQVVVLPEGVDWVVDDKAISQPQGLTLAMLKATARQLKVGPVLERSLNSARGLHICCAPVLFTCSCVFHDDSQEA